jgi:hypothetical protein
VTFRRRASWGLAAVGLTLAVGLFLIAQPRNVVTLALSARSPLLLVALAGTFFVQALRGLRLALLAGPTIRAAPAGAAAAISQLASGVLPLRIGELALVPLLQAAGLPGTIHGLAVLLFARILDLAAILAWGVVAAAAIGGDPTIAGAGLLLLAVALVVAALAGVRVLVRIARRWRARRGWRRRVVAQLLRVRSEAALIARSPARAGGSVAVSLLLWGGIWGVTVVLLHAMQLRWPAGAVLLGVVGGALGSSLPVNSVGTFGTQEAGWTAALAGTGVPVKQALAAGFACHLWVLVFSLVIGAVAAVYLLRLQPGRSATTLLASVKSFLRSARGA